MECPNKNKECIKHTPKAHGPTCPKSGTMACKNWYCNRECWSKEDMELLGRCLDNYSSA